MAVYAAPNIQSFIKVEPMIYAYDTPGVTYHDGWIKIGYTDKQTPEQRIKQQTHTAHINARMLWKNIARYTDNSGQSFKDTDFHAFLEFDKGVKREPHTEWFETDKHTSRDYFDEFAARGTMDQHEQKLSYTLRDEQEEAVRMTKAYFEGGGTEFLWNAKPRFGKTLTAYDLVRRMGLAKVLIVTNRPSIANSWAEDFKKFIDWRGELSFVSDTDALAGKPGVLSRQEFISRMNSEDKGMVAFESLQSLKGSVYFGGKFDKLSWMAKEYKDNRGQKHHGIDFDLLIIDAYGIIGLNSKDSTDKGFLKLSPILFSPQKRLMVNLRRKHAQNEDLSAKRSAACNFGSTVSDVVPSHLLQRQSAEHTPDVDLHRSTVRYPKDVSLACAA